MFEAPLLILLVALVVDWFFGEPEFLWSRFPHPVVIFGRAIGFVDAKFNRAELDAGRRFRYGAASTSALVLLAILAGVFFDRLIGYLGFVGFLIEAFIVFTLLAQKSLVDHVLAVVSGLRDGGVRGGREAIARIVGRDPKSLDRSNIARAAIETLAENFSDGVVAPAFWYGVFGLPGIFAYKMINTADSMIGYRSERHLHFGKVAAQLDDLANWLPARFSVLLIMAGAVMANGIASSRLALSVALHDGHLHRSPNAGWPEAAMAGALNIALGGPRTYSGENVQQAFINETGRRKLDSGDIDAALKLFSLACFCLMATILIFWVALSAAA